ncbi:MAG: hydroxyacylglutathione hydrolase [Zoogloeaceae bacterium]|jgi:hydroxyacylglutathione hydrolase|nr:hydroxyacylglutathione hydrolase [Zoogloeaceae bacterium]
MFEITAIPALQDNYIWGLRQDDRAALVDPGQAAPALAWLAREGLRLEAILVTHHHQDHQGGVPELRARFPNLCVFAPGNEFITTRTHPLYGGERLRILDTETEVLFAPGHTRGHLMYLAADAASPALFCGDVLFGAGCGRLFEGTPAQMFAALESIAALPDATRIFCAHEYTLLNLPFAALIEPDNAAIAARARKSQRLRQAGEATVPSTLALEKATNPFLRCAIPAVAARARSKDPHAVTPEQVFAVLRDWRDEM